MNIVQKGIIMLCMIGATVPLLAQEGPLKSYAEEARERKFCFYPSTLRMVNVQGDTTYNEVIKEIRKVLIYKLSTGKVDDELREVFSTYADEGFEEYVKVYGGGSDVILMGKERSGADEYVGVAGMDGEFFAFYLKGDIRWDKITSVMQGLQDNPILSMLGPSEGEKVIEERVD